MNDGTSKINPSGHVMWLVCTAKYRHYGKSLRVKVAGLAAAMTELRKWAKDSSITKDRSIKRATIYVRGAALAHVSLDGKIYRLDPVNETFSVDDVIFDEKDFAEENEKSRLREIARRSRLEQRAAAAYKKCLVVINDGLSIVSCRENKQAALDLSELTKMIDDCVSESNLYLILIRSRVSLSVKNTSDHLDASVQFVINFDKCDEVTIHASSSSYWKTSCSDDLDKVLQVYSTAQLVDETLRSIITSQQFCTAHKEYVNLL